MKKKEKKNFFLFYIIFVFIFIIFLLIFPLTRIFLLSFYYSEDLIYTYYDELSNNYPELKSIFYLDIIYLLMKNNILHSSMIYLESIDLNKLKDPEKAIILNYYAYYYYKNDDINKSKEYLIEACKLDPENYFILSNLSYILSLLNNSEKDEEEKYESSKSINILELQNLKNLEKAENQLIKVKTEKSSNTKNIRYW